MGNPFGHKMPGEGGAKGLAVFPGQVVFADEKLGGKLFQRDFFPIMLFQVGMDLVELFGDGIFAGMLRLVFGKAEGN